MYRSDDFTVLRSWTIGYDVSVTKQLIKETFEELIQATGYPVFISDIEIDKKLSAIELISRDNSRYMGVYVYYYDNLIEMAIEGKGEQIKATDLEKLYYKAAGAIYGIHKGYTDTKNFMRKFGMGGTGVSIGAGIGVAAGAAIGGGFRLLKKGVRALLRDQEAYDKEMAFYTLALGLGDYLIGGADSNGIVKDLKKNAEENNEIAQYLLGSAYVEGRGVEVDTKEGVKWFSLAASNGESRSKEIITIEYLFSENEYSIDEKQIGLKYLNEIADDGDEDAAISIIDVYGMGTVKGIPIDLPKMIELAEKYAQRGNLYACMVLASTYDSINESKEVDLTPYKDDEKAAEKYKRVIQSEDDNYIEEAAISLACMYREGRGVEASKTEEIKYCEIAAYRGNVEAKTILAYYYTYGIGTEKNYQIAQKLCNEIMSNGEQSVLPTAYYCSYIIADEMKKYKASMDYARKYIACRGAEESKKAELQKYLDEQEELINNMTDEERRSYLGEKKPLFYDLKKTIKEKRSKTSDENFKFKKKHIILGIIILAIVIAIVIALNLNSKDKYGFETEDNKAMTSDSLSEEQKEALRAYNDFLEQESIDMSDEIQSVTWYSENCDFALAYIDDNSIPELLLYNFADNDHVTGYGALYTYENGTVKKLTRLMLNDVREIGYYEKTGYYMDHYESTGLGDVSIDSMDDIESINNGDGITVDHFSVSLEYDIEGESKITGYTLREPEAQGITDISEEEFNNRISECMEGKKLTLYKFYNNTKENRQKYLYADDSNNASNDGKYWGYFSNQNVINQSLEDVEAMYGYLTPRNSEVGTTWEDATEIDNDYCFVDDDTPVFTFDENTGNTCDAMAGTAEQLFGITSEVSIDELAKDIGTDGEFIIQWKNDVSYESWYAVKDDDISYVIFLYPESLRNIRHTDQYDPFSDADIPDATFKNYDKIFIGFEGNPTTIYPSTYVVILDRNSARYEWMCDCIL